MSDIITTIGRAIYEARIRLHEHAPYDGIVVADVPALVHRMERQLGYPLFEAIQQNMTLFGLKITESPYVLRDKAVLMRGGEAVAIVDIGEAE